MTEPTPLIDRLRGREVGAHSGGTSASLAGLAPGTHGRVVGLAAASTQGDLGAAPGAVTRRLADLGFVPGTEVEVVRRAPLGDPVVFRVRGFEVCLRAELADLVEVAVEGSR